MFIKDQDKEKYRIVDGKAEQVVPNVKPGLYTLSVNRSMFGSSVTIERNTRYKDTEIIQEGVYKEICDYLDNFVSTDMYEIRKEMGMMHKLGLIFNGGIGTGKTYLAGQLGEKLAKEKNALVLMTRGEPDIELAKLIDMLRTEDPDRLIVLIMDEYEKHNAGESDMLHFLDGKDSRNNVIVIATVNSTKGIPDTIRNRKGRIEKVFEFRLKNRSVVRRIIESVIPKKYSNIIAVDSLVDRAMKDDKLLRIDNLTIEIRDMIFREIRKKAKKGKATQTLNKQK